MWHTWHTCATYLNNRGPMFEISDSYYEPVCEDVYERFCSSCDEANYKLKEVTHFFEKVLEYAFGLEKFDDHHFRVCLEEISHQLDVKFPIGRLQMVPKKKEDILDDWVEWNKKYLSKVI